MKIILTYTLKMNEDADSTIMPAYDVEQLEDKVDFARRLVKNCTIYQQGISFIIPLALDAYQEEHHLLAVNLSLIHI